MCNLILEVFQKTLKTTFTIIWISVLYVIWKDRNRRVFQNQFDHVEALLERVKLQTFWWLKANYILFNFDYPIWRQSLRMFTGYYVMVVLLLFILDAFSLFGL